MMGKFAWIARAHTRWPGLLKLKDGYDIAVANDPDSDRHGIVTPTAGLMNPNHYLAVAIQYLLNNRPKWPTTSAIGKTLVSSSMIDRVVAKLGRKLSEVPVGFKWFVRWPVHRHLLLWRRRERGGEFPAIRWQRLVDGQGRHHHGSSSWRRSPPARVKDPGKHYVGSDEPIRHAVLHTNRCSRLARTKSRLQESDARKGDGDGNWLAKRSRRN